MTWTTYSNWLYLSPGPPTTLTYQGDRRLWAGIRYPNLTRIHYEGYMSKTDAAGPGFSLIFYACVASNDAVSCGWQLFFSATTKIVTLQAFKSDGSVTPALATCSTGVDLSTQNTIAVRAQSGALSLLINGIECMKLTQITNLLTGSGAPTPTGGFTGVRCQLTNRLYMQKLYFW
jgi:hypothetical protein